MVSSYISIHINNFAGMNFVVSSSICVYLRWEVRFWPWSFKRWNLCQWTVSNLLTLRNVCSWRHCKFVRLKHYWYVTGANRRKEEEDQEMQRESGFLVNKILIMKMILTWRCDWKCWYTSQLNLCVIDGSENQLLKLSGGAYVASQLSSLHSMYILWSSPDDY